MKPDKVDHYLNKRKEREARLANEEDHGQEPNRSPASEDLNTQTSPRRTTPSPVDKIFLNQLIKQTENISPKVIKTNCYTRPEDNEAPGNREQYPKDECLQSMNISQQYYIQNKDISEQRRYLSESFHPCISPTQSRIESTRIR